jgi:hypothetical protein
MIEPALTWAGMKHKGQVRKYTGEPYMTHPEAVYRLVSDHLGVAMTDTIGVSAILHDVVEDTSANMYGISLSPLSLSVSDQFEKNMIDGGFLSPQKRLKLLSFSTFIIMQVLLRNTILSCGRSGGGNLLCFCLLWTLTI